MSGPGDSTPEQGSPAQAPESARIAAVYERLIAAEAEKDALMREVERLSAAIDEGERRRQKLKSEFVELQRRQDRIPVLEARIAELEAERMTFGAQVGRWLTRQRHRLAPAGTRRGKLAGIAVRLAREIYKGSR